MPNPRCPSEVLISWVRAGKQIVQVRESQKRIKILFDKIGEAIIFKATRGSRAILINIKFETHQMCSPRSLYSTDRSPSADNLDCNPLVLFVCNLLLLREDVL